MIRSATLEDSSIIANIYNWYIENTVISFEETTLSSGDMAQRIVQADNTCPCYVMEEDQQIIGFAYATWWHARAAYKYSRETSIYLHHEYSGGGRGQRLYQHLIDEIRKTPIHVLVAGIALPNDAGVALHEKLGFEKVGQLEEVGHKFDNYIDVGYWQLKL